MADFNLRFRRSYEANLKIRVDLGSVLGARRPEQPGTDHAQVEHSRSSSRQKLEDTSTLLISDAVEWTLMLENLFFSTFPVRTPPIIIKLAAKVTEYVRIGITRAGTFRLKQLFEIEARSPQQLSFQQRLQLRRSGVEVQSTLNVTEGPKRI